MAFLENLGQRIINTSQNAVQKTSAFADVTKLNSMIKEHERRMEGIYGQIGRLYCERYAGTTESGFAEMVGEITRLSKECEQFNAQILQAKGMAICPACGNGVPAGVAFCSRCGNRMPQPVQPQNSAARCSKCGAELENGQRFCASCGAPAAAAQPVPNFNPNQAQQANVSQPSQNVPYQGVQMPMYSAQVTPAQPSPEPFAAAPVPELPVAAAETASSAEEAPADIASDPETKCPVCGAAIEADAVFCTECGAKL